MKTFIQLLLLTLYLFLFGLAHASSYTFEPDVHYVEVKGQLSKQPQVTEYFSFYCPHCYRSEPFMADVKRLLAKPEAFKKVHVDSMPGRSVEIEHELTKALTVAKLLDAEEKLIPAIFKYIHVDKGTFTTAKDVKELFVLHGVDANKYDSLIKTADEQYKKKEYDAAKENYAVAAKLKPTQSYPKRQITAIEKIQARTFQVKGSNSSTDPTKKKEGGTGKKGSKARPEL